MDSKKKTLFVFILIPLLVGGLSGLISRGGMETFELLNKPALSPPGWLFPVVWTVLYVLMGIASYLIYTAEKNRIGVPAALRTYARQLAVNFFWPIFFFNFGWYLFSFLWLVLLWALILKCILQFYRISKPAAYLMIPYIVWVTFAGYLNLAIYMLN